jgi:hypothetical protein
MVGLGVIVDTQQLSCAEPWRRRLCRLQGDELQFRFRCSPERWTISARSSVSAT